MKASWNPTQYLKLGSFGSLSSAVGGLGHRGSGGFKWERLTRRHALERITGITTALLGIACLGLVILTAKNVIETRLASSTLVNKLDSVAMLRAKDGSSQGAGAEPSLKDDSATDLSIIASKSVFGPLTSLNNAQPTPAAAVLKDPLTLIGTFVSGGEAPYAIIEDDKKKVQDVFAVGEPIFGEGKVKRILVDRVEIERGGQAETLVLDIDSGGGDDGGASGGSGGDLVVVQEAEYTQALENLPLLLTQARAVPYFRDGKAQGLRLFAVKAGSFYERLGLKNGDVLKSINGNSLADLSQAMQLLEKLRTERSFSISVERNSEPKDLRYEIR